MRLMYGELVMSKQEAVRQTFNQSFEDTLARLVNREFIKQMFDEGCFKIEKVIDERSDRVFTRVSTLVEKPH